MSEHPEIWKDVYEWEQFYQVSTHGRVRSKPRNYGNRKRGGKRKQRHVHLLVMRTFCGPAPEGLETCHNDGNPLNAQLSNLRYDTAKANAADRIKHGTRLVGEKNPTAKLTTDYVVKLRTGEISKQDVMSALGVTLGCVDKAKYGANWKHI